MPSKDAARLQRTECIASLMAMLCIALLAMIGGLSSKRSTSIEEVPISAYGKPYSRTSDVHVVIAGDRAQSLGIMACARSVYASTQQPKRIMLHVIVDKVGQKDIEEALRCSLSIKQTATSRRIQVYPFVLQQYTKGANGSTRLHIRVPFKKQKTNLASDLNFARFYLSDLLAASIEKVIYLDADTIVLGDVANLYDETLTDSNDFPFAAVSRKEKKICGAFLNCAVPEVARLMHEHGIFNPEIQLNAFNAGIMVMHLKRWKMLKYTEQVEYWIRWNQKIPLYDLASNPPLVLKLGVEDFSFFIARKITLVLAARGRFEYLNESWNCQRLHACWHAGNASILHWNGIKKPWHLQTKDDRTLWLRHLQDDPDAPNMCIKNLPPLGKAEVPVSAANLDLADKKTAAMSKWAATTMNVTRRDVDLLQQIEDMATKFAKIQSSANSSGDPSLNENFAKVRQEMLRSINIYQSVDPPRLIFGLAEYFETLQAPQRCNFILVAVLNGRVFVDVSAHRPSGDCGRVLPDGIISFLFFFSVLLDQSADFAIPLKDVAFVICTSIAPAKTTQHAPVFLLGKAKSFRQPGILVPGPAYMSQDLNRRSDHKPISAIDLQGGCIPGSLGTTYAELASLGSQCWDRRYKKLQTTFSKEIGVDNMTAPIRIQWSTRRTQATWRGRMNSRSFSCFDDAMCAACATCTTKLASRWARIEILALAQRNQGYFDVHLTSAKEEPDNVEFCLSRANLKPALSGRITKMLRHGLPASRPTSGNLREYFHYRYALMLPEYSS